MTLGLNIARTDFSRLPKQPGNLAQTIDSNEKIKFLKIRKKLSEICQI